MRRVQQSQALIGLVWLVSVPCGVMAAEEIPEPRPTLVAVPSFQAELPDGTPVMALIIIPAENVLNKNVAWQAWEAQWPTHYRIAPSQPEAPSSPDTK